MSRALISRGPMPGATPVPHVDMTARLGPMELPTPVRTASGCAAAGRELDQFFDVSSIGAVVTKTIMMQPRSGRATPRMAETPSGMLNSIGLKVNRYVHYSHTGTTYDQKKSKKCDLIYCNCRKLCKAN